VNLFDETKDALFQGEIQLTQSRRGYRFSLDAILLAYFANLRPGAKAADLGAGNGVIALILAYLHPSASITGVEIQSNMVARAQNNVRLNDFEERIAIIRGDVREIDRLSLPGSYDAVVCNPPYRKPASGRISPDAEKRIARHEIKAEISDFVRAGVYLLRAKGIMALIYPAVRSIDLLAAMRQGGLEPKRLRMVHSYPGAVASLILAEGVKGGRSGTQVLAPLVIYQEGKKYTSEVQRMLLGSMASDPSFAARGPR